MKAAFFKEQGSLDNLEVGDFPDPEVGEGMCCVRVHAAALNGFEPMMVMGVTGLKTPLPMIPCGDVAGEIVEVSKSAQNAGWKLGDRVLVNPWEGTSMMGETALGGACEYIAVKHSQLIPIPDGVPFSDAACTIIAYGTAHRMIGTRGRVGAGDTVLILGATGGVGVAAVQFAKQLGATVIACGSSDWKIERLKEIGADQVINTRNTDIETWVKEHYGKPKIFGTGGVDVVVNYIGGETWEPSLRCLKLGGKLLNCGATAGHSPVTDLRYLWSYELDIIGSNGWDEDGPEKMLDMMASGSLSPVIHDICPLESAPKMLKELYDRNIFGKVVFDPTEK